MQTTEQVAAKAAFLLCYLVCDADKHALTPRGEQASLEFVAKSRFGPYFLWPHGFNPV